MSEVVIKTGFARHRPWIAVALLASLAVASQAKAADWDWSQDLAPDGQDGSLFLSDSAGPTDPYSGMEMTLQPDLRADTIANRNASDAQWQKACLGFLMMMASGNQAGLTAMQGDDAARVADRCADVMKQSAP